mgnify:CR=1 FL=1
MRGDDQHQDAMWSYISPERRVPQDHPLRPIREMANEALKRLSAAVRQALRFLGALVDCAREAV